VYLFNDLFPKPVAQLVASVGKVTDGLILKIQSEGLFIDDDVRSIPQREWDVKAWTLKMVEVSYNFKVSNTLTDSITDWRPNLQTPPHPPRLGPRHRRQEIRLPHRRIRELEIGSRSAEAAQGQPGAQSAK
jgi:hypothetical protein